MGRPPAECLSVRKRTCDGSGREASFPPDRRFLFVARGLGSAGAAELVAVRQGSAVSRFSRRVLPPLLAATVTYMASCGSLIHPDRVGRPHGRRIDPAIVLLDGLGLLCFFVPGVIAFAVDFGTGAIWLPPGTYGATEQRDGWHVVRVPPEELTDERIEAVVSGHVGRPIRLSDESLRIERLRSLDDVPPTVRSFGPPSKP